MAVIRIFFPVLHYLAPDDQLPSPDQVWLTRSSSLDIGVDAAAGIAVSLDHPVPLNTLTDVHLGLAGPKASRHVGSYISDYQIPPANEAAEPLSPAKGLMSGVLEITTSAPGSTTTKGPVQATLSYDTAGNEDTTVTAGINLLGRIGKASVGETYALQGSTYSESATRIEMTVPLNSQSQQHALTQFWGAMETRPKALPTAEQALYSLIKKKGEITITSYRIQAATSTPFTVSGGYRLLTATASATASNETTILTGARYWADVQQGFVPWTRCTQGPGAASLHLPAGA